MTSSERLRELAYKWDDEGADLIYIRGEKEIGRVVSRCARQLHEALDQAEA